MEQTQKVINYFNRDPGNYAAEYDALTAEGYSFRVRKQSLLVMLGSGSGRVLDIGCGPGVMSEEIAKQGWEYWGMDFSPEMIAVARKKFSERERFHFSVGQAEKTGFPENYFEAVVAMGLVEYLDDETAAVQEIRRVLKPNGILIVSLPNWWSPMRMWDRWLLTPFAWLVRLLTRRPPSTKLIHREYRLSAYRKFLREHGFETLEWQTTNYRIIPRPFDFWFPRLAVWTASWLERHLPAFCWFLGTSINLKACRK
jgi:2-polyprenyl-6-hydroxyphenyl methylase/3-demethylubiquinone-9 3-methyltransferase